MKILFITSDYRPVSGWGRLCFEVISRLEKENQLVVLSEKKDLDFINNDFKVLQISSKMNFISIVKNCIIAYKAGKNVDIIHANDIRPYGIYAYVASGFGKKKYIINGVGTYSVAPLRNNLSGKIFRHIYKHAHFVPCISVYTKMRIDDKIKGVNTKVVHMGLSKFKNVDLQRETGGRR